MPTFITLLAEITPEQLKEDALFATLRWGVVLVLAVIVGGTLVSLYRSRFMRKEKPTTGPAFELAELRAMRDRGDLTIQEFEAAYEKITAATKQHAGLDDSELSLPRIRDMRDRGELTPDQYEIERKKIIERLKGKTS